MNGTNEAHVTNRTAEAQGLCLDVTERLRAGIALLTRYQAESYAQGIIEQAAHITALGKDLRRAQADLRDWQCIPGVMLRREEKLLASR